MRRDTRKGVCEMEEVIREGNQWEKVWFEVSSVGRVRKAWRLWSNQTFSFSYFLLFTSVACECHEKEEDRF